MIKSSLELVSIRNYEPDDEAFIYQTWLKGYRHGNSMHRGMDTGTFEKGYRPAITALLKKSLVKIACLKESPNVVLGYSVSEGTKLHWIFVRSVWKGMGIMSLLLPLRFNSVSHKTNAFERILKEKFPHVKYDPFL